uniref:Uncharacterized protein n=1 Tax=Arundo donax TaxID=35708 RepID=A0A0A8YSZ7_ARUDO
MLVPRTKQPLSNPICSNPYLLLIIIRINRVHVIKR